MVTAHLNPWDWLCVVMTLCEKEQSLSERGLKVCRSDPPIQQPGLVLISAALNHINSRDKGE